MRNDSVSVVIPYAPEYTPGWMLEEAKESVRQQPVETELVVVAEDEPRGPAWARNRGLERAETRFVAFMDADDLWTETKLPRQLDRMAETDAGLCVEGEAVGTEAFIRGLLIGPLRDLTSSILVDTHKIDVRFNEALVRREDHFFLMEAASRGGVCFCSDIVTLRKHNEGLSEDDTPAMKIREDRKLADFVEERVPEAEPHLPYFRADILLREAERACSSGSYPAAARHIVDAVSTSRHPKLLAKAARSALYCII